MARNSTRNRPGFPGFSDPPDVAPLITAPPPGEGRPSSGGVLPRPSGADPTGARDFTTTGQEFGSADH